MHTQLTLKKIKTLFLKIVLDPSSPKATAGQAIVKLIVTTR